MSDTPTLQGEEKQQAYSDSPGPVPRCYEEESPFRKRPMTFESDFDTEKAKDEAAKDEAAKAEDEAAKAAKAEDGDENNPGK